MKKTNKLLSKYLHLYKEQVPGEEVGDQSEDIQPDILSPDQGLSENEKYVIKILINAFIFSIKAFDKDKQKYILSRINSINNMINVPLAKVIDEIKNIIALNYSLKIESKTNKLLKKHFNLIEQSLDATEPQSDKGDSNQLNVEPSVEQQEITKGDGLPLEEIFPLYRELILKSLKHTPTEDELMILKPIVRQFTKTDPEKIVITIKNLLSQSTEDKEVEDNLSNA